MKKSNKNGNKKEDKFALRACQGLFEKRQKDKIEGKFGKVCQELFERKQKEKIDGGSLELVSSDDMMPEMYCINVVAKWHESHDNITPNNEKYTYVIVGYYLFNGLEVSKIKALSPAIVYFNGDYAVLKHADEVKIKPQFSPDEIGFFTTDIFNLSVLYMQTKILNEDKGEQQ